MFFFYFTSEIEFRMQIYHVQPIVVFSKKKKKIFPISIPYRNKIERQYADFGYVYEYECSHLVTPVENIII